MLMEDQERVRLEEELKGLKNVIDVAQVVVSSLDLDAVLGNILRSAMAVMDMPAGSLALYNQAGDFLELHAHHGFSSEFITQDRWTPVPGGLTDRILSGGEVLVIEDTRQAECFNNPLALKEGIRSLVAVPLKIHRRVVGILYVNDFVPRPQDGLRRRMLKILASFAALSIENAQLHQRTQALASTDGLTGLGNYRQFKKQFAEELARAGRYHKSLALVMFDVDDFKAFNDRYGHPMGDRILVAVADILRDTLRDCDFTYRYGGEEFMAMLPESSLEAALAAAERARVRIAREAHLHPGTMLTEGVTVSAGVAVFPGDGEDAGSLLQAVDDLLYAAKRKGKNKVHHRPG